MCGIAQSFNNGGQGEEYEDERLQRHVLHASRSARAHHAGAFADTAQMCSRSDSVLSPAVSQGHSTASPASTIPSLPCSAMPGLTFLPPSRAAMRASARSRPRPYPALASVVCVLMLPCVCPFLVRLSLLASLVCLSLFSSEIGDISSSCAAPPPRSPSARPACPAASPAIYVVCVTLFLCWSWCCVGYNRVGSRLPVGCFAFGCGCFVRHPSYHTTSHLAHSTHLTQTTYTACTLTPLVLHAVHLTHTALTTHLPYLA